MNNSAFNVTRLLYSKWEANLLNTVKVNIKCLDIHTRVFTYWKEIHKVKTQKVLKARRNTIHCCENRTIFSTE